VLLHFLRSLLLLLLGPAVQQDQQQQHWSRQGRPHQDQQQQQTTMMAPAKDSSSSSSGQVFSVCRAAAGVAGPSCGAHPVFVTHQCLLLLVRRQLVLQLQLAVWSLCHLLLSQLALQMQRRVMLRKGCSLKHLLAQQLQVMQQQQQQQLQQQKEMQQQLMWLLQQSQLKT
jgi:hypothetical protein